MPVGAVAAAFAIARPRAATRLMASMSVSTPATTAAASSPTECPAVSSTPVRSVPNTARRLSRLAATMRGWALAVSRIVSASAVVPKAARSTPAASLYVDSVSAAPGSSSHGLSIPGVWAPWPGHNTASTYTLSQSLPGNSCLRVEPSRSRAIVGRSQTPYVERMMARRSSQASVIARLRRQPADHQRKLQNETLTRRRRIPPHNLGDAAQSVAHRVGVNVQRSGGALEGTALAEVFPERLEERPPGCLKGPVQLAQQRVAGERVAVEEPLREELIGFDEPRRLRPRRGRQQTGECGPRRAAGIRQGGHLGTHDDDALAQLRQQRFGRVAELLPAEHDDEAIALDAHEGVLSHAAAGAAQLRGGSFTDRPRRRPDEHGRRARARPAQRAGAGTQRIVEVPAHEGIDHEGFEARVPCPARLRGPGVDLGGGKRDLAGVAQHGLSQVALLPRRSQLHGVVFDYLDDDAHELQRVLQRNRAGELRRGR